MTVRYRGPRAVPTSGGVQQKLTLPYSKSSASEFPRDESSQRLDARIFNNAAVLKVALSELAMHLSLEWRRNISKQIDHLLSEENWDDSSSFAELRSFKSFLRFIAHAKPSKFPSLGIGLSGNILAAWYDAERRISVEFKPSDNAKAFISIPGERAQENVLWTGHIGDLATFLERLNALSVLEAKGAILGPEEKKANKEPAEKT